MSLRFRSQTSSLPPLRDPAFAILEDAIAKLVNAEDVEQVIRGHLERNDCTLQPPKKNGETGPDIEAAYGESKWFVEIIGFQEYPPIRSREFCEAFFRLISRDEDNSEHTLALGLPKRFKNGMRQRASLWA